MSTTTPTRFQITQAENRAAAAAILDSPYPKNYIDGTVFEGRSWEYTSAFADELASRSDHLTRDQWGIVVSAVGKGLPVVIDTRENLGVRRGTYIIEHFAHPTSTHAGFLRVRTWGFAFNQHIADIVNLSMPTADFLDN
ncbi:hypothetical protein [Gordonia malaquae]|uniref:hypothetical protein n=1 Tax=Gordonia malaquae TaxID=410332 RepID=UPI0030183590